MKYNLVEVSKDTNYLRVTKDTILPALIGAIAGGLCGSIEHGTFAFIVFFGLMGALVGIILESAFSMRIEKSETQPCEKEEPDEDAKEYVLVNHDMPELNPSPLAPLTPSNESTGSMNIIKNEDPQPSKTVIKMKYA